MGFEHILKELAGTSEIVSVFCNPDDAYSTVVGSVAGFDGDYFVLKHIDAYGLYDGYVLRQMKEIFRIDRKASYENNITRLYAIKNQRHADIELGEDIFQGFLRFAASNNFVVSAGVNDHDSNSVTGYIENIDFERSVLEIHTIAKEKEGGFDGYTTASFDSIKRMSCDDTIDRAYMALNSGSV